MNRPELTSIVADKVNTTKKQADELIDAFLETIIEALQEGEKVVIFGIQGNKMIVEKINELRYPSIKRTN